jgi:ATP-dependent protease ClpP protease subunit
MAFGVVVGHDCLLLATRKKGKWYMLPHTQVMLQQPRLPPTRQIPAIDIHIRARSLYTIGIHL